MCDVRQLIAACSREIRGLTENSRRNGSFPKECGRQSVPQTDPSRPSFYASLPFDQGALIRFPCRTQLHPAVLPRDCIIQANNILPDAERAIYKNETVCFRIRSLLRFRGISPQKAPSADRMKQISRSTKMYCARIKTEVSICAMAADMTRLRVCRVVAM